MGKTAQNLLIRGQLSAPATLIILTLVLPPVFAPAFCAD